jgi:pyruvate/2-oxoglutarate dehydrogenase complex dihydrolipoamide dehydrogenase (E3) component
VPETSYVMVSVDLVVIGGGAGALAAARTAQRRGARVTLVSDAPLGGDCTFYGCVPSKTLLSWARRGVGFDEAMAAVHRTIGDIAATESFDVLRGEGIAVINDRTTFTSRTSVDVGGRNQQANRFVIATGATPAVPPIPGLDRARVLTNEELFKITSLPKRLGILGGGPIGVEMAEAFALLGSQVTIVEAAPLLIPREEPEASVVIRAHLERLGVTVLAGSGCATVTHSTSSTTLTLESGVSFECDALLVAVGRTPSSAGLGLDAIGVVTDKRGFITVNPQLRTSVGGIFAVGDVSQTLQFTHVADETGRIAASNATSNYARRRFHPEWIPMVTFTGLEVARVGLIESEVHEPHARVAYLPMSEFDRARMTGDERGFVKIIVVSRRFSGHRLGGAIVGATIVAPHAGEMIAEVALAMRTGMWPARIATSTHAYPTWGLAVQQTVAQYFGEYGGRTWHPANVGEQS